MSKFTKTVVAVTLMGAILLLTHSNAYAVASYARQTGLSCTACHTTFPELTSVGRDFKLNAYTTTTEETLDEKVDKKNPALTLLKLVPLSASLLTSITTTDQRQPGSQNPSVEFPQRIMLYLAGQITPHFGTFLQVSYTESGDHLSLDNSDVRYVGTEIKLAGKSLLWGLDVNNHPTFEDLWNSTPGYGFPYTSADSAGFAPMAATLIDNTVGHQVVGGGPYAMWDNHLYALVSVYRSQHLGDTQPETGVGHSINIHPVAPYWRLAWQQNIGKNNYFEIGTYGIYAPSHPNSVSGPTDKYTDVAADATYERTLANGDLIVLHTTFIHELTDLTASVAAGSAANAHDDLNTFRLDASYHFGSKLTLTAGPFFTWGTSDSLRYAPGAVTGFANGKPDNSGYILQAGYWPWQNFEIGVQYRGFTKFNGASSNYDGTGRNASDNNTLYAFIWMNF